MGIADKCPDWVSVVAFYSALHFVEAYMKRRHGLDFKHHEERLSFMSINVPEIFSVYQRLYDMGFDSRYRSLQDAPSCEEAKSVVKFELADVEKFVMERL
jgi:hypothetical protein